MTQPKENFERTFKNEEVGDVIGKLGDVTNDLARLTGYGKRTRQLTRILAISFVVDIIITSVLAVVTAIAIGNSANLRATADAIHESQVTACQNQNDTRADEVALWHEVIRVSTAGQHLSAEQKASDEQFLKYVERTFKPIDCTKIYKIDPPK